MGNIDLIHGPLDGPLYMGSHIHQQYCAVCVVLGVANITVPLDLNSMVKGSKSALMDVSVENVRMRF